MLFNNIQISFWFIIIKCFRDNIHLFQVINQAKSINRQKSATVVVDTWTNKYQQFPHFVVSLIYQGAKWSGLRDWMGPSLILARLIVCTAPLYAQAIHSNVSLTYSQWVSVRFTLLAFLIFTKRPQTATVYLVITVNHFVFTHHRHPRCGPPAPLRTNRWGFHLSRIRPCRHPAGRHSRNSTVATAATKLAAAGRSTCRT